MEDYPGKFCNTDRRGREGTRWSEQFSIVLFSPVAPYNRGFFTNHVMDTGVFLCGRGILYIFCPSVIILLLNSKQFKTIIDITTGYPSKIHHCFISKELNWNHFWNHTQRTPLSHWKTFNDFNYHTNKDNYDIGAILLIKVSIYYTEKPLGMQHVFSQKSQ